MDNTKARLRSTQLTDRTLWFDGDSSYNPDKLQDLVRRYDVKYVDQMTDEVRDYNKHVSKAMALQVKEQCRPLSKEWNLPKHAKNLDVIQYVFDKHYDQFKTDPDLEERERRLSVELVKYDKYGFFDVLRAIIFIINNLTAHNVVWGVGRGSSVSSYVLYVIGVHDVDSYAYDLDIDDFLHE